MSATSETMLWSAVDMLLMETVADPLNCTAFDYDGTSWWVGGQTRGPLRESAALIGHPMQVPPGADNPRRRHPGASDYDNRAHFDYRDDIH